MYARTHVHICTFIFPHINTPFIMPLSYMSCIEMPLCVCAYACVSFDQASQLDGHVQSNNKHHFDIRIKSIWLVVWNIFFHFIPIDSYFSEGLEPRTSHQSS